MNWRRIAVGTVVLGIVGNVIDYVLNTYVLTGLYTSMSAIMNPSPSVVGFVIGDFAAAFMLMLAWDRYGPAPGSGVAAGAQFGAFAGIFITFPAQLFNQILLKDVPYRAGWTLIAVITVWYAVLGAVGGAIDKPAKA